MSLYFASVTVENNKNKKSIKFQGDKLIFCDFIQVFVFTTNHHLNRTCSACLRALSHLTYTALPGSSLYSILGQLSNIPASDSQTNFGWHWVLPTNSRYAVRQYTEQSDSVQARVSYLPSVL